MNPRIFISHASEDKDRFVLKFAEALRSRGIDAWLDEWEMMPGDSLVRKIEEGIEAADAFLVVLSQTSVAKPWVRHELDIGVVRMIEAQTRLIPVVIDGCTVPTSLQHLLQIRVKNLADIDSAVDDVVTTVTGGREKPPLGNLPGYAAVPDFALPGLTQIDNLVLTTSCDMVLEKGHYTITGHELWERIKSTDIPEPESSDSLEILTSRGLLRNNWPHSNSMHSIFEVALPAFDEYLKRTDLTYAERT
jgi:hypothetical protein